MDRKDQQNQYERLDTQLLVIGGGLAGMRAAEEAFKRGVRVLLLCDGRGASAHVHGLNIPVTKEDSAELFLEDTLKSGKNLNDPVLAGTLCRRAQELLWEFSFDRDRDGRLSVLQTLGASCPRVVGIQGAAGAVILGKIEADKGFEKRSNVRALRLLKKDGRISGALCYDIGKKCLLRIHAQAVILACGGFGGIFGFSTNPSDIGGDGIAMAFEAGARLADMEFIQFEPTAAVAPASLRGKSVITTMLQEGAVMKNGRKEDFLPVGRVPDKDELSRLIYREIREGRQTPAGGIYYDVTGLGKERLESCYGGYVERYRKAGVDITAECMEVAPAPHTTLGGVLTDSRCKTSVEGLFACGEVTGGLHGANRLGGNAGLEVLIFGKLAGESAAEYLSSKRAGAVRAEEVDTAQAEEGHTAQAAEGHTAWAGKECTVQNVEEYTSPETAELRKKLEMLLEKALGVVRCGRDMAAALKELDAMEIRVKKMLCGKEQCGNAYFQGFRLYNDILTSRLALRSAMERKGSIGVHTRTDSIEEDGAYHIILEKGREGEILVNVEGRGKDEGQKE